MRDNKGDEKFYFSSLAFISQLALERPIFERKRVNNFQLKAEFFLVGIWKYQISRVLTLEKLSARKNLSPRGIIIYL